MPAFPRVAKIERHIYTCLWVSCLLLRDSSRQASMTNPMRGDVAEPDQGSGWKGDAMNDGSGMEGC